MSPPLALHPRVAEQLAAGGPVVALESTLISFGLPWPLNLETARAAEEAVRAEGAVPATVGVWQGRPTVGLDEAQLEAFARDKNVRKASRRDLAAAVAQQAHAATTVAGTLALAHAAGLRVFATGGIGGVHRTPGEFAFDVSADLVELARTPVAVVCAGAKSVLDLQATLEVLETLSVPVVGYGTDTFPAFYLHTSGLPVAARVDTPAQAAALVRSHWQLGGAGVVLARPLPEGEALPDDVFFHSAQARAEEEAVVAGMSGPALTPFLLSRLAEHTAGRSLRANQALVVANARLAAQLALALAREDGHADSGDR
jgi:pseudouridine-5'-phosphate glycosidase